MADYGGYPYLVTARREITSMCFPTPYVAATVLFQPRCCVRTGGRQAGGWRVGWLLLAALGIMWVAFLLPSDRRQRSAEHSVEDFERRMELLAHAELQGSEGRWIVTPRKGARFVGVAERRRARLRERRRKVLVFLLESIGLTFLIGLVPPLHTVWASDGRLRGTARPLRLVAALHQASCGRAADPRPRVPRGSRNGSRRRSPPSPLRGRQHERLGAADVQRPRLRRARATGSTWWSGPPATWPAPSPYLDPSGPFVRPDRLLGV